MAKLKLFLAAAAGAGAVLASMALFAAQAQTAQLSTSCSGSVSGNTIVWSASASGGNAPYSFLWTGDKIGGNTATSVSATYSANGTFMVGIRATDASSTVATSTCSATVNVTTPTSTPPTSTSTFPRINQPTLIINPGGNFLARGMTVTSVSAGSFQGQVWGITYTINWSGNNFRGELEFLMRFGNPNPSTSTPAQQLAVGDEVGVSGRIDPSSPFTVNANVVRDYSIIKMREEHHGDEGEGNGNGNGNSEGDHGNHGPFGLQLPPFGTTGTTTASATVSGDAQLRIQGLLKQLKSLQDIFHNRFGGNGNDHGQGNGGGEGQGGGQGY